MYGLTVNSYVVMHQQPISLTQKISAKVQTRKYFRELGSQDAIPFSPLPWKIV